MAINATKSGGEQLPPIEEGTYPARIYSIIHIGTGPGYQGKDQNKARITFELPTEKHTFKEENGPEPRVISSEYTLSFHEKAKLRKVMDACLDLELDEDGFTEFDISELAGKTCMISIVHKKTESDTYANIDSASKLVKGMTMESQHNATQLLDYENWNQELFDKLPDFLKVKIGDSKEYKEMKGIKVPTSPVQMNSDPFNDPETKSYEQGQ